MYRVVIAGAGTGSMTFCGQLIRSGKVKPSEIAVFDPAPYHYYQPGFTMLAGGLMGDVDRLSHQMKYVARETRSLFHPDVNFISKPVTGFFPNSNKIGVDGSEISYEHLVVGIGLSIDYNKIPGLYEALEDENSPVGTIYQYKYCLKTNRLVNKFKGGQAIFTQPNQPFKCGGAPQKIMYLANSVWNKTGVRDKTDIHFYIPPAQIFGVQTYAQELEKIAKEKGCNVHYQHLLTKVDPTRNEATFKKGTEEMIVKYDFLHTAPPQGAPKVLQGSPISNEAGYVDVNPNTLRHNKYGNIWAIGDCTSCPTSKTAAAAIGEAPVLVHNLGKVLDGAEPNAKYEGYTSCPIFLGDNKLMLCEFKYQGQPDETFGNQNTPSSLAYYLVKTFLPRVYFTLLPKGVWYGRNSIFKPKFE
ncbi:unnamed protein product [Blepharisma stoltei]|uniref:Sulfide:quinone oxidoreductase, mitochondrial n=1 Tax=Blepharisma stoltei TaxID=1481888 RepID=A0AAU9I3K6_9CILI|nr:unnamed protein product [Blepharisma stoltei]